jgi:uncharacterized membrane protein
LAPASGDRDVPLPPIRLVVGSLLLVFGLQWLRKGVLRVAAQGWAVGQGEEDVDDSDLPAGRFDRTGFVLSCKGVMVVALGGASGVLGAAVMGAAAAVIVLTAVGATAYRLIARIPRRALQLSVGALLSAFGTYGAGLGVGVSRPGGEPALLWLAAVYASSAVALLAFVRGGCRPASRAARSTRTRQRGFDDRRPLDPRLRRFLDRLHRRGRLDRAGPCRPPSLLRCRPPGDCSVPVSRPGGCFLPLSSGSPP